MNFICIKYSGLKFNYIFETNDFIFIPKDNMNIRDLNNVLIDEFFSCKYDESAQFYILCKKQIDFNPSLDDISDDLLYEFRFIEAIIGLLFSNRLVEDSIIVVKKENEKYETLKIFKNISRKEYDTNPILVWKNYIITERLKDIINGVFSILKSVDDPKAFSLKYFFCFDMYLKGKFNESILLTISYLWISLEILATITIINILKSDRHLFPSDYIDDIREIVKFKALQVIPEDEVRCWNKLKEEFADHIKHKINTHLPIRQKVIKVAEEYLDIEELKTLFKSPEEFDNHNDYELYEEKIRDFRQFQDNLTLKNIIDDFNTHRNALFHGGGLPEIDNIFERQKDYFCLLIERLFFKILSLDLVKFKIWGYLSQYLWIDVGEVEDSDYFSNYSHYVTNYIIKTFMFPLNREFRQIFEESRDRVIENFYTNREDLFYLIDNLNNLQNRINSIIRNPIELLLINNENAIRQEFELNNINRRELSFFINTESSVLSLLFKAFMEKEVFMVENRNKEGFLMSFRGFIEHAEFLGGPEMQLNFIIIPEYICFYINNINR